jgi:hypothetical protein
MPSGREGRGTFCGVCWAALRAAHDAIMMRACVRRSMPSSQPHDALREPHVSPLLSKSLTDFLTSLLTSQGFFLYFVKKKKKNLFNTWEFFF